MKQKNTTERGRFKEEILTALYKSEDIRELILGDTAYASPSETRKVFKEHVKSHLFIDDTIEKTGSYIFFDVRMPRLHENIKQCEVLMYVITHEDLLDQYSNDQYPGNRTDALSQMIEECLVNDPDTANAFGIGSITLNSVDIYLSKRFHGCIMRFGVYNFR